MLHNKEKHALHFAKLVACTVLGIALAAGSSGCTKTKIESLLTAPENHQTQPGIRYNLGKDLVAVNATVTDTVRTFVDDSLEVKTKETREYQILITKETSVDKTKTYTLNISPGSMSADKLDIG